MGFMGIDFSDADTAVVYYDEKTSEVIVIPNHCRTKVGKTLPSVVAFDRDGNPLYVGDAALSYGAAFPHLCVDRIERVIAKSFEEALRDPLLKDVDYKIVEGERDEALIEVGVRRYRPEEVASLIFMEARERAETYLRVERGISDLQLTKVIVTIPAHFNANQANAVREAAHLGGFERETIELLDEPTAAVFDAVFRGKITRDEETILVINVGSGTTDLALVDVRRTTPMCECRPHCESFAVGAIELGGTDMDIAIVDWVIGQLSREEGVNQAALESIDKGALRVEAEEAKIALSEGRTDTAVIKIRKLARYVRLTKGDLENVVKPIVEKCMQVILNVLSVRAVEKDDLDHIILAGEPAAVLLLRKAMVEEFGDRIIEGVDPILCVARGAAVSPKYLPPLSDAKATTRGTCSEVDLGT